MGVLTSEVAEHVCGWGVGVQKNPDPSPQCGSPRTEEAPSQGWTRGGVSRSRAEKKDRQPWPCPSARAAYPHGSGVSLRAPSPWPLALPHPSPQAPPEIRLLLAVRELPPVSSVQMENLFLWQGESRRVCPPL